MENREGGQQQGNPSAAPVGSREGRKISKGRHQEEGSQSVPSGRHPRHHRPSRKEQPYPRGQNLRGKSRGREEEHRSGSGEQLSIVYLPLSAEMLETQVELRKTTGMAYPVNGEPWFEDIIGGIHALSDSLYNWQWNPFLFGKGFVLTFPSTNSLDFLTSRPSIPCSSGRGSFRVARWTGEEGAKRRRFNDTVWQLLKGLPIHGQSRDNFAGIISNFGHLIEIDPITLQRRRMDCARIRVGCKPSTTIPERIQVLWGDREASIEIEVEKQVTRSIPKKKLIFGALPEKETTEVKGAVRSEVKGGAFAWSTNSGMDQRSDATPTRAARD